MYWLEVSVITDGEGAEAIAEALKPFAHQESVVLEQLGDMEDLDPNAHSNLLLPSKFTPLKKKIHPRSVSESKR